MIYSGSNVLSQLPVPGSIEVSVYSSQSVHVWQYQEEEDWTYDNIRNGITSLEFVPGPLDWVEITYEILGSGVAVDSLLNLNQTR